jgi:hypothetical protein
MAKFNNIMCHYKRIIIGRITAFFSILILLLLTQAASYGEVSRTGTPEDLINLFYEYLLAEIPPMQCPEIFYEPETFVAAIPEKFKAQQNSKLSDTAIIWEYLRQNKQLFLFSYITPAETTQRTRLNYLFSAFPKGSIFFEGRLSVVLIAPLSKNGKEGIIKEIAFPLERNDISFQNRYLLNLISLKVNGILLDPAALHDRTGDLYQQLGFTTNSSAAIGIERTKAGGASLPGNR